MSAGSVLEESRTNHPGPLGVARHSIGVVKRNPKVAVPFLILGPIVGFVPTVSNLISVVAFGFGLLFAYEGVGGAKESDGGIWPFVRAYAVSVIQGFAVLFGLVLLVIPGLVMVVAFQLALPAVFIGGAGITEAISDSFGFARDHPTTVVGVLVIYAATSAVIFFTSFLALSGTVVASPVSLDLAFRISIAVTTAVANTFYAASLAIMFGSFDPYHDVSRLE